jgi:hypothetical protein
MSLCCSNPRERRAKNPLPKGLSERSGNDGAHSSYLSEVDWPFVDTRTKFTINSVWDSRRSRMLSRSIILPEFSFGSIIRSLQEIDELGVRVF